MTSCYILPVERPFCVSAITSQHTGTPLAMAPLFHGGNFLVKLLSVLIAHCAEIFWEET